MKEWGLFIDGAYCNAQSKETFNVHNPKDNSVIAKVAKGNAQDIKIGIGAAKRALSTWSKFDGAQRSEVLHNAADLMEERLSTLIDIEVEQIGRPIQEMRAQVSRLPEWFRYFGSLARTEEGILPPFGNSHLNYVRRVPLGVVGAVTPWNHPLLILTKKIAPALAAGNTVVAKPSELAPITPLLLGEIFVEAGLPKGAYNIVPGFGADAGAALVGHPEIEKIDVTGGTETGKVIASLAGQNLTEVSAELGGKAAVVIFPDTDLERAVAASLFASFIATGQTCVQGSRVLVHESIHDDFVHEVVRRTKEIRIGDPQDKNTQMGPLISEDQRALIEKYVAIGIDEGAHLATGGARPQDEELRNGFYYQPTIFTNVSPEMRIAREEIFGPVMCIMPFSTEQEAQTIVNDVEFGLATSIWTKDITLAHRFAHGVEAGIVWINDHHRIDPASPWGGFKMSGLGRENGKVAYHSYTQMQNIIVNLSDETFDWYSDDNTDKRYS